METPDDNTVSWLSRFPPAAAAVTAALAAVALAGWTLGVPTLRGVLPGLVAMNPLTATAFLLAAAALWFHQDLPRATTGLGVAVGLIGALKLTEYLFDWTLGLDRMLFRAQVDAMVPPNRMAPNTALCFALIGAALACLPIPPRREHPSPVLALAVSVLALTAITGYAYRAEEFFRVAAFIPMALNTAGGFLVLSVGVVAAGPRRGGLVVLTSTTRAGATARLLLGAAVVVPVTVGWLRIWGERFGLYSAATGTVLFAMVTVTLLAALVRWQSLSAYAAEQADVRTSRLLRESERQLAQILDAMPVGVFVVDASGKARFANRAARDILGKGLAADVPAGELPETYQAYVAGTDQLYPSERQPIVRALAGESAHAADFEIRRPDRVAPIEVWAAPVRDAEGNITHAVAAFSDITERRQARERIEELNAELEHQLEELQEVNRELETFSYSVSHDLRAPLRAIDGFSRILIEDHGPALDDEAKRVLGVVRQNTERMGLLIDDLLRFSRLSRKQMEAKEVDMTETARSALEEARGAARAPEAEVTVGPLPRARGDLTLIRQVWVNLLGNALKYSRTQDRPRVEVGGYVSGSETIYSVADNGVGFDPAHADQLFAVFQRLHRHDEFEGTGVGLAIVQRVVHRHGGRVWAEGRLGQGATFYFALPAALEETEV